MSAKNETKMEIISPQSISSSVSPTPDRMSSVSSTDARSDTRTGNQRRSTRIVKLEEQQERRRQARQALHDEITPTSLAARENSEDWLVYDQDQWEEPPLAKPTPIVTGLPIGAPPSKKIKKEALWPKKRGFQRKLSKKSTSSNDDESDAESDTVNSEPSQLSYQKNLKTKMSEPMTVLSTERLEEHSKIKPVTKRGSKFYIRRKLPPADIEVYSDLKNYVPSTPTKQSKKKKDMNKKIKRSPQKNRGNAFGFGAPDLAGQKRAGAFDFDDTTKDNEDFCSACGGPGIFLCCEACPKSFHFLCCDPPLDEDSLPEGNWYCNECLSKRGKTKKYTVGIFSKLLNQSEIRNPRKFQLPRKLRESTFENVSTGPCGEYQDSSVSKNTRPIKLGKLEEADPLNIYDKNGKPLICYRCGLTGLNKEITKCGYCDLSWHLDCLNPPLPSVKTLGTKWKCPNHVADLIPTKKRRYKRQNYVDVSMSRGFKNNGDVEIAPESEEEVDNNEEDESNLTTPAYMNTYYKDGKIHAPMSEKMEKIITMNNITYRIPEKGVILDFIDSSKIKKLGDPFITMASETDAIESMADLKSKPVVHSTTSFKELLSVVNSELSKSANGYEDLTDNEIEDLKYLKKLIDIKGRDNLLRFLQS